MKTLLISLTIIMTFISCEIEPRAINYGEDSCYHCKMKLMDPHFGVEVVTKKGKIFVFDDVNCLMTFLETKEVVEKNIHQILVTDYHSPHSLAEATTAFYLKSNEFKTPMASNIVAFSDYKTLQSYKLKHSGVYMAWGELISQFK